jgi:outer membrane immunogenic protein
MKKALLSAIALGSAMVATPAFAQDEETSGAQPYIGLQVGTHDAGVSGVADDNGIIAGLYAGVDVPVSGAVFVGAEVNYNLGWSAIDREYGAVAKLGTEISPGTKLFVRGGYQEVDFDLSKVTGLPGPFPAGTDDDDGDYLVGVGGDFGVSDNVAIRAAVDTIAFDSVRATAGVTFRF